MDKIDLKREIEETYDNQYEMLSMLPKVKSSIKNNVTSDYTMAVLNKDEKDFITDNYSNAEYAKEILERFGNKGYVYKWNEKKNDWYRNEDGSFKKFSLTEVEKELLYKMGGRVFTFFMIQPHMMAILNRNDNTNFMVKLLGKASEDEKPVQFEKEDRNVLQKIGDWFKTGGGDYEED